MADIARAYRFLNDSLKLGLSKSQLEGAEKELMRQHLKANRYPRADRRVGDWEFFLHVKPRRRRGSR